MTEGAEFAYPRAKDTGQRDLRVAPAGSFVLSVICYFKVLPNHEHLARPLHTYGGK